MLVLTSARERIHGQAFNVGATDENYQIRDVARIVGEVVPDCRVEFAPGASADVRNYRVSCDKIADQLGFRVAWNVRRGAEELYEAYLRTGLTLEAFEGPTFQRIAHVRQRLTVGSLGSDLRPTTVPAMPPTVG
jgi:hypothetical protein